MDDPVCTREAIPWNKCRGRDQWLLITEDIEKLNRVLPKCEIRKFEKNGQLLFLVLEEIRPYLIGTADGSLDLVEIEDPIVQIRIAGPAAGVMMVRVAVTQKLREKIPAIAAVQLI